MSRLRILGLMHLRARGVLAYSLGAVLFIAVTSRAADYQSLVADSVKSALATPTAKPKQEPLAPRIDQLLKASFGADVAPSIDDSQFLRRVYLDFAGRIPSVEEARSFLAEAAPDKRAKLIDQLLAGPEYPRRMKELFHVMLMERRGDNEEWLNYLEQSFAANKPWDQIVREILAPQADDTSLRGAAYFHTRRLEKVGQQEIDYPGLTRDIGRLFMGVDLQCAQCHDHLFIDEYRQVDFQGLYTVVSHTLIRTDTKFPAVNEKPIKGKTEFTSVFEGVKKEVGPRVPFGSEMPLLPLPAKGKPPESSLALLAESLPTAENHRFTTNIANRLWFTLLGRGLIHPLDLQHAGNPPSHPELMKLLATELAASGFDLKYFMRELALTDAYARASSLPSGEYPEAKTFAVGIERRLSAEQMLWSLLTAVLDPAELKDETKRRAQFAKYQPKFVKAFANPTKEPEESYQASLQGVLFTLHDPTLTELLTPSGNNLVARLTKITDKDALIDELYLALLVRKPSDAERLACTEQLDRVTDDQRPKAITQIAWALISGLEFSLNH